MAAAALTRRAMPEEKTAKRARGLSNTKQAPARPRVSQICINPPKIVNCGGFSVVAKPNRAKIYRNKHHHPRESAGQAVAKVTGNPERASTSMK
jgi:hypothetical protein